MFTKAQAATHGCKCFRSAFMAGHWEDVSAMSAARLRRSTLSGGSGSVSLRSKTPESRQLVQDLPCDHATSPHLVLPFGLESYCLLSSTFTSKLTTPSAYSAKPKSKISTPKPKPPQRSNSHNKSSNRPPPQPRASSTPRAALVRAKLSRVDPRPTRMKMMTTMTMVERSMRAGWSRKISSW